MLYVPRPSLGKILLGLFPSLFLYLCHPRKQLKASKTFSGRKSLKSTNSPLQMLSTSEAVKAGNPPLGAKTTEAAVEETAEVILAPLALDAAPRP